MTNSSLTVLSPPDFVLTIDRKYNPIERYWGVMGMHWNGTQLIDVETMLEWAKRMTWKGLHPLVTVSRKVYQKACR
jgi:hypothetical protein